MVERDSFIFYRSFLEALEDLEDKQFARVFRAIAKFALDGKEIELTGVEKVIFKLVKPQLEANRKRYENGCRGGRRPNQIETEDEPSDNQKESISIPNDNVNDNVNDFKVSRKVNKETNKTQGLESYQQIVDDMQFTKTVENKVWEFIKHCIANKHVVINSELESMLIHLDMNYDDDESKIMALDDAIRYGYTTIRR